MKGKRLKEGDNRLGALPSVSRLLEEPRIKALCALSSQELVVASIRTVLQKERSALQSNIQREAPPYEEIVHKVEQEAQRRIEPSLRGAINATGVILHTGLGRARLAEQAVAALIEVAKGHCVLEIERESGRRGLRQDHVRGLLCELTGAEDALVLNNCTGAVFLAVTAVAQGREVILSRGELVEIGGAFRMPDIVLASGATLIEVGTTNRTRLSDYAQAITERTGLLLRCRPSNFAIIGFTETPPLQDLVALGHSIGIPVMDDQGSGALLDVGGSDKGTILQSIKAGCDLVTASGDKLLGGPQAGLVLGKPEYVEMIARHPLSRALRVDKLTLAALEATLRLYLNPKKAMQAIPTLRYLLRSLPDIKRLAQKLRRALQRVLPAEKFFIELKPAYSQVGGGSLPGELLETVCVALRANKKNLPPDVIARLLRMAQPPVFARVQDDWVLLDPRTIEEAEISGIAHAAATLLQSLEL